MRVNEVRARGGNQPCARACAWHEGVDHAPTMARLLIQLRVAGVGGAIAGAARGCGRAAAACTCVPRALLRHPAVGFYSKYVPRTIVGGAPIANGTDSLARSPSLRQ
eukprot:7385439-Prymnesium_polylepis.1